MVIKINVAPEKYLEAAEVLKSVAALRRHGLSLSLISARELKTALQEIIKDLEN